MTLDEFIAQFDKENAIVLLEGKRNVKEEDQKKLKRQTVSDQCKTTKRQKI